VGKIFERRESPVGTMAAILDFSSRDLFTHDVKLSVRGEYAIRALLVLARDYQEDDSVVRIQEISDRQNIPKRFLEQILNDLKSAHIVESKRGVAGGYRLRRRPEQINLAQVVRHIEGPLAPVGCVSEKFYEKCSCPDESRCAIRSVMKETRDAIVGIMERVTLAELAERSRKLEQEPMTALDFNI
jgi:Rrf2 family protein